MNAYRDRMRQILSDHFKATRNSMQISQEKMSELLGIDVRSYAELEHGRSLCSTPVLLRFMFHCNVDQQKFLSDLESVEQYSDEESTG